MIFSSFSSATLFSAATASGAGAGGFDAFLTSGLLPLVLVFGLFYFLVLRPEQTKRKQHQAKIAAVTRGEKVLTGGGLVGKVTKVIDDDYVEIDLGGMKVRALKATLADIIPPPGEAAAND